MISVGITRFMSISGTARTYQVIFEEGLAEMPEGEIPHCTRHRAGRVGSYSGLLSFPNPVRSPTSEKLLSR